eukprot:365293-Chlamydomonas_euryale.AAC.8
MHDVHTYPAKSSSKSSQVVTARVVATSRRRAVSAVSAASLCPSDHQPYRVSPARHRILGRWLNLNADFDGDHMAVHVPMTVEAGAET